MSSKVLNILIADAIKIPSQGLLPALDRKIQERLVFTNPEYEARHNRGEWIGSIPPQISCIRKAGRSLLLPRGFLDQLVELCKKFQQPYRILDRRRLLDPEDMEFYGQLKDYQQDAAEAILDKDFATLIGGHKSGKTVIALYVVSQRRQPTLVMIPRLNLLESWMSKIESFLQIPSSEVGLFIEGTHKPGKRITVAHTGEMMRHWREMRNRVGQIVLADCERCPSKVFTHLVPSFDTRYMLGLAGTAQRRDRLSRFIYYYLGDVVYSITEKDAREGRGIIQADVVTRATEFEFPYQSRSDYLSMIQALMRDKDRARLIADDIQEELREHSRPLIVLSGGEEQNRTLKEELEGRGIDARVCEASLPEDNGEREDEEEPEEAAVCADIPLDAEAILVSSKTFTRCFRNLSSRVLFLAVPVYFKKPLAYAIRSLHGNGSGERLKIYDYVDQRVSLLDNYFRMRSYNYGAHPNALLEPH